MNQFTFEARQKATLGGFMILGLLCMGLTAMGDDGHYTRLWSNYLHNSVFFTGIALFSLFIISAFTTAWAGWYSQFKRIFEAYSLFLIPGLVLMLVVVAGLWGGMHHLYHWADPNTLDPDSVHYDPILVGKSSFLNANWYTFGTLVFMAIWIFFAWKMRQISLDEDNNGTTDWNHHHRMRIWAAAFLPIAGFTSAAVVWQWVMSVDSHWYSTLFAWYCGASWFVSAIALGIMSLAWLKSKGYYERVSSEHLHDLGKFLFAFSIFWTYLWFSQFMLIWYGNNGEETVYFFERMNNYPVLFYGNLAINFILPFFILMRNDTKRKYGTLIFASILVLFGHWLDFFLMIKPGVLHTKHEMSGHHGAGHGDAGHHGTDHAADAGHHIADASGHGADHAADAAHGVAEAAAHHASSAFEAGFSLPGLLEVGTFLGFLAFFMYMFLHNLSKANLEPKNEPYLGESYHHHV